MARRAHWMGRDKMGANQIVPKPPPGFELESLAPPPGFVLEGEADFGKRADGTSKGLGYFGILQRPDRKISTELSIGVNIDGKETEIPSLVPTLTRSEIDYLLAGGKPTEPIVNKAKTFAIKRLREGKNPFAQKGEQDALPSAWADIPATDPFTELAITPDVAKTALSAVDIGMGGPVVRGLLSSAPTVPEFAGTGEEIPTASTRRLLELAGRSIGETGPGGFMPESPTTEYRITPELGEQALPIAAELALYPALWRFAGKTVEGIADVLSPWYIKERGMTAVSATLKAQAAADRLSKIDALAREGTGGEQLAAL
jgi:hypothetical protein